MNDFNVYIGYDQKSAIAAEVCKFSILRRTDQITPPDVYFLKSESILEFTRQWEPHQSTDFTYTRFMIPYIEGYRGFSVFCDCDFLFLHDIADLVFSVDETKAVSVVQHPRYSPRTEMKMDGRRQHGMDRKNWASLIVFNNAHPSNKTLHPSYVNHVTPGRRLHKFDWLRDDEIGHISLEWNTLDEYYYLKEPKAIHYTDGGPWFKGYENTMYSKYWWNEFYYYADATRQPRTLQTNSPSSS